MTNPVLGRFQLPCRPVSCEPYGSGHINRTFRVVCENGQPFILQKVNTTVFHDPDALMENIRLVTEHLMERLHDTRRVLSIVPAADGGMLVHDNDDCWRMFVFVGDSVCFDAADTPERFGESAVGFATFFNEMADFDATQLVETIPHFHDTPARIEALHEAVRKDACGRVKTVLREIEDAARTETFAHTFADLQAAGQLPLRVTHNDTKINNVLFDAKTGRSLCVLDLDTVMPGLIMNDFGDAIRFGASTAAEDERALDRVWLDLNLYEVYVKRYLAICGGALTRLERTLLPAGAKMMTFEVGSTSPATTRA